MIHFHLYLSGIAHILVGLRATGPGGTRMDDIDDNTNSGQPMIAHVRKDDGTEQGLNAHCEGVSKTAGTSAATLGLAAAATLLGLVHDWGKASRDFQIYLRSATDRIDQDADDFVDAVALKGKIDHSTAAAQWIWDAGTAYGKNAIPATQALALCLCSHHSGLIDCLSPKDEDVFSRRIGKPMDKTHLDEALARLPAMTDRASRLIRSAIVELHDRFAAITKHHQLNGNACLAAFDRGLLVRCLFSCLIDADRLDTATFETPKFLELHRDGVPDWDVLIERLEHRLEEFQNESRLDRFRRQISDACRDRAEDEKGIFTLTVPTGGGKTLAGLRFALRHARRHGMMRIVHVIPYTSIIDQNAGTAREILEPEGVPPGSVVLEHHSDLEPKHDTWVTKHLGETWDAPVIYTTMVQFLEAVFGSGTRGARRLHRLTNAVIVFDEIQTLPVRCVHLFCNAVNFLVRECGSSVVLCTATQPLLDQVDASKGRIEAPSELMQDPGALYNGLERVKIEDHTDCGHTTMTAAAIAALASKEYHHRSGNCLVVVNTKRWAMDLYCRLKTPEIEGLFHLSTDMCAVHRRETLDAIKARLAAGKPTLCVSTQLIEAGVDIDFRTVIRFLAGLDSIAQAAGRCNRNGSPKPGRVHIVAPDEENLSRLPEIERGKLNAIRVLDDFADDPDSLGNSLLHPKAISRYFKYAFFEHRNEMDYPVDARIAGHGTTLLDMLAENRLNAGNMPFSTMMRQSFMTAARAFQVIDAPTEGVVVPYGEEGREIAAKLQANVSIQERHDLLHRAQRFSVNLYPWRLEKLLKAGAIHRASTTETPILATEYYSMAFGLSDQPVTTPEFLNA